MHFRNTLNEDSTVLPGDIMDKMDAAASEVFKEFEAKTVETAAEPPSAPEAVKTEPESQPAPTAEPTPQYTKDYDDLVRKFDGDVNRAAAAYWETNNRAAALAKRVEELEAATKQPAQSVAPPAPEPEPVVPEDVKRFDDSLRAIEAQYEQVRQDHIKVQQLGNETKQRIDELTDQLLDPSLELDQRAAVEKELRAKRVLQGRIVAEKARLEDVAGALTERHGTQSILRSNAETLARLTQERENSIREQTERNKDQVVMSFGEKLFTSARAAAKEGKIPEDVLGDFIEYVTDRSLLKWPVASDLQESEIPAFLADSVARFNATHDRFHRSRAAQYAKDKLSDATVSAPEGGAAVAKPVKQSGFRSQRDVDAFMEEAVRGL